MPTRSRRRADVRPGWAAFGLIGLLVVVAIVLYLMFGTGGTGTSYMEQVGETRDSGRKLAMDINTRDLVTMIATHQMNTGELPADMAALEAPPGSFDDPWGTQLRFSYEDERAPTPTVLITSAGPDLEFDTEDDVLKRERLPF